MEHPVPVFLEMWVTHVVAVSEENSGKTVHVEREVQMVKTLGLQFCQFSSSNIIAQIIRSITKDQVPDQ